MIARHDTTDKNDIWAQLAAPLPADCIAWRQDGRPTAREGKYFARFVSYIEAGTVRERLDAVIPGEWDLTLELLPTPHMGDGDGEVQCAFKARLQILGVIREDVGAGKDYKQASTDSFKRAAVRFGIGHELYDMPPLWVQVDGDGKYAKPVEDPAEVYARKSGKVSVTGEARSQSHAVPASATPPVAAPSALPTPAPDDEPSCPSCGGRVWDNRLTKRNPKAPDYKCRSRTCDGVIWPARAATSEPSGGAPEDDHERDLGDLRDLPF